MKGRTLADQKKVKKMSAGGSSMSLMHSQPMGPMASKSKSLLPSALQQRLQSKMNAIRGKTGMKTGGISKRK